MLLEIEQTLKRYTRSEILQSLKLASMKDSLIMDLNLLLNDLNNYDLNNPMLQFHTISKQSNSFTVPISSTPKKNLLKSKFSSLKKKVLKITIKTPNLKQQIKIRKVISADHISSCLGYASLILVGLTTLFRQEYCESDQKKPMDNLQSGVRIERSLATFQDLNSAQLDSKLSSQTSKGIIIPGNYFGQDAYLITEKSDQKLDLRQPSKFEIEGYIYSNDGSLASNTNPIISDPLNPIMIDIEAGSDSVWY